MSFKMFFIKVKKNMICYVFYLQINVFNIYATYHRPYVRLNGVYT